MKVAIALAGTDRGRSGIGVWVREVVPRLLTLLRSHGDRAVLVGTRADLDAYDLECDERLVLPALFDGPGASAAFHLVGLLPIAARAGADVVLLPAANRRFAWVGARVPTVAVVHDLASLSVRGKYDALRTAYVKGIAHRGLPRAGVLVAVSASTAEHVSRVTGSTDVRVVSNGVDAERFTPRIVDDARVESARAALGLVRPYVLYVSRLEHPGKNHVRLVRAFAACDAASTHDLVLAGPDWGAADSIRAASIACGVEARVRIVGRVHDAILPGLVAGCDALAMVGLAEGFGLPALEALAAGRPVLAARAGALPEVVGSLAALADPLDERALCDGLTRALTDEALRARCRDEGPAWAARHDWNHTAAGVLHALKDAA